MIVATRVAAGVRNQTWSQTASWKTESLRVTRQAFRQDATIYVVSEACEMRQENTSLATYGCTPGLGLYHRIRPKNGLVLASAVQSPAPRSFAQKLAAAVV